jgi:hypothetical protein
LDGKIDIPQNLSAMSFAVYCLLHAVEDMVDAMQRRDKPLYVTVLPLPADATRKDCNIG